MTKNQKVYLFLAIVAGTAVVLWGPKGIFNILPGPNPK